MPRLLYAAAAAVASLLAVEAFMPPATGGVGRPRVAARRSARARRTWLEAKLESITVEPIEKATGTVVLPGSKSLSNRALLLAALSEVRASLAQCIGSRTAAAIATATAIATDALSKRRCFWRTSADPNSQTHTTRSAGHTLVRLLRPRLQRHHQHHRLPTLYALRVCQGATVVENLLDR